MRLRTDYRVNRQAYASACLREEEAAVSEKGRLLLSCWEMRRDEGGNVSLSSLDALRGAALFTVWPFIGL